MTSSNIYLYDETNPLQQSQRNVWHHHSQSQDTPLYLVELPETLPSPERQTRRRTPTIVNTSHLPGTIEEEEEPLESYIRNNFVGFRKSVMSDDIQDLLTSNDKGASQGNITVAPVDMRDSQRETVLNKQLSGKQDDDNIDHAKPLVKNIKNNRQNTISGSQQLRKERPRFNKDASILLNDNITVMPALADNVSITHQSPFTNAKTQPTRKPSSRVKVFFMVDSSDDDNEDKDAGGEKHGRENKQQSGDKNDSSIRQSKPKYTGYNDKMLLQPKYSTDDWGEEETIWPKDDIRMQKGRNKGPMLNKMDRSLHSQNSEKHRDSQPKRISWTSSTKKGDSDEANEKNKKAAKHRLHDHLETGNESSDEDKDTLLKDHDRKNERENKYDSLDNKKLTSDDLFSHRDSIRPRTQQRVSKDFAQPYIRNDPDKRLSHGVDDKKAAKHRQHHRLGTDDESSDEDEVTPLKDHDRKNQRLGGKKYSSDNKKLPTDDMNGRNNNSSSKHKDAKDPRTQQGMSKDFVQSNNRNDPDERLSRGVEDKKAAEHRQRDRLETDDESSDEDEVTPLKDRNRKNQRLGGKKYDSSDNKQLPTDDVNGRNNNIPSKHEDAKGSRAQQRSSKDFVQSNNRNDHGERLSRGIDDDKPQTYSTEKPPGKKSRPSSRSGKVSRDEGRKDDKYKKRNKNKEEPDKHKYKPDNTLAKNNERGKQMDTDTPPKYVNIKAPKSATKLFSKKRYHIQIPEHGQPVTWFNVRFNMNDENNVDMNYAGPVKINNYYSSNQYII